MRNVITFLVWLPFAGSLGFLSYQGGVSCKLPEVIAIGLAACLTCAGSVYAARFRSTRSWVDFGGMLLTLSLCVALDFANLYDTIQRRAGAEVLKASAGANADASEVARLRAEVSETERAWTAAKDLAEAERTQGKVSGRAGKGGTFDRLTAEASNLESLLQRRETALREALAQSKAASVMVAEADGGRHILALVPPWVLLVGAAALELSLAGLGWGMGETGKRRRADAGAFEVVSGFEETKVTRPCFTSLPVSNEPEIGDDDEGSDQEKVIQISAEELKALGRLVRRGYRGVA